MNTERTLRCYYYVNQSFAEVAGALRRDAIGIFERATNTAAECERASGVQLRVRVGVLDVATDVRVEIGKIQDSMSSPLGYEVTVFPLTWSAAWSSLFSRMTANLSVYPFTRGVTQLGFEGTYDTPLGVVGEAIDAEVGHRIAEATVLQFLREVAALLRAELGVKDSSVP